MRHMVGLVREGERVQSNTVSYSVLPYRYAAWSALARTVPLCCMLRTALSHQPRGQRSASVAIA